MPNQNFKCSPSRRYFVLTLVGFVSVLLMTALLSLPIFLKIGVMISVFCYGAWILYRDVLLFQKHAILAISQSDKGIFRIQTRMGEYAATLRSDSTLTSFISILRFQSTAFKRPLSAVIFRDSLPPDQYRQLIVMITRH